MGLTGEVNVQSLERDHGDHDVEARVRGPQAKQLGPAGRPACSQRPAPRGPLFTGGSTSTKVPISCRLASSHAPPPDGKP